MKFNSWSKKRIKEGKKRLTSRKEAHVLDDDVEYITARLSWMFIRDFLYRDEGADSPEELQREIDRIFRRKVEDEEMFYVHVLKEKL